MLVAETHKDDDVFVVISLDALRVRDSLPRRGAHSSEQY